MVADGLPVTGSTNHTGGRGSLPSDGVLTDLQIGVCGESMMAHTRDRRGTDMPTDPNDITYVRPRLAKRRKGAPHVHEFRLVESCDCCGVQIDLFEALLPDAATDLAGDTPDQTDPEMHLLGVTGLGDAVVGVSHRLRATPAAGGRPPFLR